jgi:Zn-dependent protease
MGASFRLGRVAGIEVRIHWSLAIVFALIVWTLASQVLPDVVPDQSSNAYWIASVVAALLFYASLLSHEMGHALVAERLGVVVEGITLWMFGGVARLRADARTAGIEAKIAIAGPFVSLVLALAFGSATYALDAGNAPPLIVGGCLWLAASNAVLLVFNLLPAYPLDGGRLLRAALWRRSGDRFRATSIAALFGRVCAFLMVVAGLATLVLQASLSGVWLIFLGLFLMTAVRSEESQVLRRRANPAPAASPANDSARDEEGVPGRFN